MRYTILSVQKIMRHSFIETININYYKKTFMIDIKAVILAGGYGTRIKHLISDIPKPMFRVANRPFIEWIIFHIRQQGINKGIISTGYLGEVIEEYFNKCKISGININCCQEKTRLGTAGGFIHAVKQSNLYPEAWLVMNGDSLVANNFEKLVSYLDDQEVGCVILGISVDDTSRYGSLVCDKSNNLLHFSEKEHGQGCINGGIYIFRHRILEYFPSKYPLSFEYDVFPTLLQQNIKIKVCEVQSPFLDIGTPETLTQAEKFIKENFTNLIKPC